MKNETAIDFLLKKQHELRIDDSLSKKQYLSRRFKNEHEAKEIFKEQLIEAYRIGFAECWCLEQTKGKYKSGEQYFKENFE